MDDDNCEEISKQKNADFQCFQYMCFPWDNDKLTDGYNTCRDSTDCKESEDCFRHWNARKVNKGICLDKREAQKCTSHDDCSSNLSCVNGYCGDKSYLQHLSNLPCSGADYVCEGLLFDACCYDLSGDLGSWSEGSDKRCCNNHDGIIPPNSIKDSSHMKELEKILPGL